MKEATEKDETPMSNKLPAGTGASKSLSDAEIAGWFAVYAQTYARMLAITSSPCKAEEAAKNVANKAVEHFRSR